MRNCETLRSRGKGDRVLRTPPCLLGARALDAPQGGRDRHCDALARFDPWKRCQRLAPWRTGGGRLAHVMHGNDDGQHGTSTPAVSLRPGGVASLAGRGRRGRVQSLGTSGWRALLPVAALGQGAARRGKRFPLRLPGRGAWHQAGVWGPPVVACPRARDRGLLRQYHGLWGEGRGLLAAHGCLRRRGKAWWLSLFHTLMVYQLFLASPILSDGHDGVSESLPRKLPESHIFRA